MRDLLEAGADIDLTDRSGASALSYAVWNFRLSEILVDAGAKLNILTITEQYSALHLACNTKNADVVELLIKSGADIEAVNRRGRTPLLLAIHSELETATCKIIEILLRYGADINRVDHVDETC